MFMSQHFPSLSVSQASLWSLNTPNSTDIKAFTFTVPFPGTFPLSLLLYSFLLFSASFFRFHLQHHFLGLVPNPDCLPHTVFFVFCLFLPGRYLSCKYINICMLVLCYFSHWALSSLRHFVYKCLFEAAQCLSQRRPSLDIYGAEEWISKTHF